MSPVLDQGAITALSVTLRFRGDASGVTRLSWPDQWAGERKLGQWARAIRVVGARSVEVEANGTRIIHAHPNAPLTVSYHIVSAYPADPNVEDSRQSAPIVRPRWFYAAGEALFARPAGDRDEDRPARFVWAGPRTIGFASDLQQHGRTLTLKNISESIVIGGHGLHVASHGAAGQQVRVARIGHYAFAGPAFDTLVFKVIEAERAFWRVREAEPFLVTMAPIAARPHLSSFSGTGRGDAFALWMDTSAPLERITWMLGHEYFHTWNNARLGRALSEPAERGYWFSEGLTDFYASRLMLRAGLISPEQFAVFWNEKLSRYASSPFRTATNDVVAAKFWSDPAAYDMQYQRGALLAVLWDRRLRAAGKTDGLDSVLRTQAARLVGLHDQPTAIDLFIDTARGFGLDVRPDIAAHIEYGEPLLLPENSFGPCARIVTEDRARFERGWDTDATSAADNVVTGLDPSSPAYAAGLRNGMKILQRLSGVPDDSRVDYVLRVADGAAEKVIRFRPAGKTHLTVQELVLDKTAIDAAPDRCRQALAG